MILLDYAIGLSAVAFFGLLIWLWIEVKRDTH